jgi:hypothetical protein
MIAGIIMKNQNTTQTNDVSYLTPEINNKQKLVDFFNVVFQICVGVTFLTGLFVWIFANQLDNLKTKQIIDIKNEQKQSNEKIASLTWKIHTHEKPKS